MGKAPGSVSGPGGKTADRTDPEEDSEQKVEIHFGGDGTGGGGGLGGGEYIRGRQNMVAQYIST